MDTVALVEQQIDEGQRLIDRLVEEGIVIRAACWVKPYEKDRWLLYIVTPLRDEKGPEAYGEVLRVFRSLGAVWMDSADIRLVGESHPLAHELSGRLKRYTGQVPPQFPGIQLDVVGTAEDAYIYPLGKVDVPIYGLTFRGDPSGLLHLSFEPFSPNLKFVEGSGPTAKEYSAQTGLNWIIAAPAGAKLERGDTGLALIWDLHGTPQHSSASEVLSLAKLGLHGFLIPRQPDGAKRTA
jgi:hypothetical protein